MLVIAPIGVLHSLSGEGARKGAAMNATGRRTCAGIAIEDGNVVEVGDDNEILGKHPTAEVVDASDFLVTPGLVDCHTHLVWAGDRSGEFLRRCNGETYQQIAASGGGILSTMDAVNRATTEDLVGGIVARAQLLLESGTTAFEIKASYGLSRDGCQKELDAIATAGSKVNQRTAVTFMAAHAFPPSLAREEYLDLVCGELMHMAASHSAKPQFCDVFCEEGAFTVQESERVLEAGIEQGLKPKIHSDEFNALGGTEMACRLGAVSCDHLLASGEKQIATLANSDTIAVTMPGTAYYLNKPYADARKMVDSGCVVALGTDFNPGSSMVASMAFVMGLAVSRMGLTPEEALTAATANAAAAIGLDAGRLVHGSPADLCIWPCRTLEELAYHHTFIRPSQVYIAGKRLI